MTLAAALLNIAALDQMANTLETIGRSALMAKSIRRDYGPDDPIYSSGPQVFVPVSRPLIDSSTKSTAGEKPATPSASAENSWTTEEAKEQQSLQLALEKGLLASPEFTTPVNKDKA